MIKKDADEFLKILESWISFSLSDSYSNCFKKGKSELNGGSEDGNVWNDGTMRYIDPSDGWQLTILFDENDNATYMEWKLIPGG